MNPRQDPANGQGMNGWERVTRTLEFTGPDRIPVNLGVTHAARLSLGGDLDRLLQAHPSEVARIAGPFDYGFNREAYRPGGFVDEWGSGWEVLQAGLMGHVKAPVFSDFSRIDDYTPPVRAFKKAWAENLPRLEKEISRARGQGRFILAADVTLFERMQFLRGMDRLFMDLVKGDERVFRLKALVREFYQGLLEEWLKLDIDAVNFGDDWGTQQNMLISPAMWRELFRPEYEDLFGQVKAAGKKILFRSNGHIRAILPDLVEIGMDAVRAQIWCMDVPELGREFAGEITFWGEISRQDTIPYGSPQDIRAVADKMKDIFFRNGGLIGYGELNSDTPLANAEALLTVWND